MSQSIDDIIREMRECAVPNGCKPRKSVKIGIPAWHDLCNRLETAIRDERAAGVRERCQMIR